METASSMKRNFIWNTAGSVIYFACQWLFTILVVRLSPAEMGAENSGYLTTALTLTSVFLSLASYGMYSFQVSDMQQKYAQSAYVNSRIYTCAAAVLLCGGVVVLGAFTGENPYDFTQCVCIMLCLVYRLVESVTDVYNAIDQKHGRLDIVGKTYAARGVLSLVLFALTLQFTGSVALTLLLMTLGNIAFFVAYTLPKTKPFYTKTSVPQRRVLALLQECFPLAVYTFLSTTAASIPKIMLERTLGTQAIGIYGPVTAPVLLLQVGATYLFTPFITVFADRYAQKDEKGFLKAVAAVQGIILAMLPLGLLVAKTLGTWGLATFVSQDFAQYAFLLAPMVFSAVLTASVLFYSMVLTVMRCMKGLIVANVCGIAVSALVSVACIEQWNLQGTTYAAIIALSVQAICLLVAMVLHGKKHFSNTVQ